MASAAFAPDPLAAAIAEGLRKVEIESLDLWDDLDALSTHTRIEGIEVPVEGVVPTADGRFTAVMNLYVTLQYGKDDEEGFITSDSFLAKVAGRWRDGSLTVDGATVDTSSFDN